MIKTDSERIARLELSKKLKQIKITEIEIACKKGELSHLDAKSDIASIQLSISIIDNTLRHLKRGFRVGMMTSIKKVKELE